jgi:hypothetical protein
MDVLKFEVMSAMLMAAGLRRDEALNFKGRGGEPRLLRSNDDEEAFSTDETLR